jgi:hypothetical protein
MNNQTGMARRYHWHSPAVKSFVADPHTAVIGQNRGRILNLSDSRAEHNRQGIIEFARQHPDRQLRELRHLSMDRPHQIQPKHVDSKRLGAVLAMAYEGQFRRFTDLLLLKGIGPRTVQSLALVSEVIWGAPSRFDDPARFAFAHGGKDGAPFPVPLKVYDESIDVLRTAVRKARIDRTDKIKGIKALSRISESIERHCDPFADVRRVIRHEWKHSHRHGGMTVKGPVTNPPGCEQMDLFG